MMRKKYLKKYIYHGVPINAWRLDWLFGGGGAGPDL